MKIYTKKGDRGETSTYGNGKSLKCDFNINAVGEVDELNAVLGLLVNRMGGNKQLEDTRSFVEKIQGDLFVVGAALSGKKDFDKKLFSEMERRVVEMEENIDWMWSEMPALHHFIIPGGSEVGSWMFIARTVARRAERAVVGYKLDNEIILKYMNRISDYFFCAGRWVNFKNNVAEKVWKQS